MAEKLIQQGIHTAHDLASMNAHLLRKQYNVILMRTAMELQGVSCLSLEEAESRHSILSSRSFGSMQTDFEPLAQAISSHCANASAKLRRQHLLVQSLSVFVKTNRFRADLAQYHQSITIKLEIPTDDLRLITHYGKEGLRQIYKAGFQYKK